MRQENQNGSSQLAQEMDTAAELHAPLTMLGTPSLEFAVSRKESQKLWLEALNAYVRYFEQVSYCSKLSKIIQVNQAQWSRHLITIFFQQISRT